LGSVVAEISASPAEIEMVDGEACVPDLGHQGRMGFWWDVDVLAVVPFCC